MDKPKAVTAAGDSREVVTYKPTGPRVKVGA
jgi:hypothetical protein